jgi:hypothetical protein
MSAVDCRLSGCSVCDTNSHAVALSEACSKGGQAGLATATRLVIEGKIATGPSSAPKAHGWVRQADVMTGLHVRELGMVMEEQGQSSPLPAAQGHGSLGHDVFGFIKERPGKTRLESRGWTRHKEPFKQMTWKIMIAPSGDLIYGIQPYAYF